MGDDLQKFDSQVDTIVHRLERQWMELDPKAQFKVRAQRQERSFQEYIQNWQWDEAKYPRSRAIVDTMTHLMGSVGKIDEEARNKTLVYNEAKTQQANISTKATANMLSQDLIDVLTPDVVKATGDMSTHDFIYSEHMTTVCVILTRGTEKEFTKTYEAMSQHVVPNSLKKFSVPADKDGNTCWRVVLFKGGVDEFKKACRDKRFAPRDFEYCEDAFKKLKTQRETIDQSLKRNLEAVLGLYKVAWSDAMVAWVHIKATRIFVESVLRFGMPPSFAAFAIAPTGGHSQARESLESILGKESEQQGTATAATGDDGEEYFPYVSFSFTPFSAPRA